MKIAVVLAILLVLGQATQSRMFMKKSPTLKHMTDHFGRSYTLEEGEGYSITSIDTTRVSSMFSQELMVKNVKDMTAFAQKKKGIFDQLNDTTQIEECRPSHSDYFKFTSKIVASPKKTDEIFTYESFCFNQVAITIKALGTDTVTAVITTGTKKTVGCGEAYFISTGAHFHLVNLVLPGEHKFIFNKLSAKDMEYITGIGVRFLRFCDTAMHFLPDLFKTIQMFLGGLGLDPRIPFFGSHVPQEMQEANVEFIKHATGFQWRAREPVFIDLDPKYIRSGDFLAITRFDGLDNIIHWGAGSHSGHSVMALWDRSGEEPELYIVESQDAWYWPTAGLQRTKWATWKKQAFNADFNVAILPLRAEFADRFNEDRAWEWFRETQGMPYGYRNFLFGWIDTLQDNYPEPLDINYAYLVLRMLEYINPQAADTLLQEALNWRLGTQGLKMFDIELEANRQGKTLNDLFAMVEVEGHKYSDGYSYVCSSYVMSYYTRSGMLGEITAYATEFTPRDVYSLDIFDLNWTRPQECINADPELPYCQIMGQWKMDLPDYSTVTPYSHMAERCPTIAPWYDRPDGC